MVVPASVPEQSYKYWLTVQKMRANKPDGGEIEMTGQEVYGNGWKFRFNFDPAQKGALYLLNEAPGPGGRTEFNTLFPTPENRGTAALKANQQLQTRWYVFDKSTGVEKLWVIWTSNIVPDLDPVFRDAARQKGVLNESQIAIVQTYLKRYESEPPVVNVDKAQKRTEVKGKGYIVVNLLELSHEAY